jgi:hypothetical protein
MDNLQEMAAVAVLNKMFKQGHFSIYTIDRIAEMTKVPVDGEAYRILSTLHFVEFADMPTELREVIPRLIRECLSLSPIYEFEHLKQKTIIVSQSPVKRFLNFVNG